MSLIENRVAGALSRAANRWQRAFLITGEAPASQWMAIAVYRDSAPRTARTMPSPFRPRRA
ncbi:MAG: hypothetical protein B7Z02_02655 [Rhodobacterales bacterium 32-67-9]|nr:MAG: hypothetical protein B7Z02_02655 [Rhodobacterales bacterium 32-67-9]